MGNGSMKMLLSLNKCTPLFLTCTFTGGTKGSGITPGRGIIPTSHPDVAGRYQTTAVSRSNPADLTPVGQIAPTPFRTLLAKILPHPKSHMSDPSPNLVHGEHRSSYGLEEVSTRATMNVKFGTAESQESMKEELGAAT